jgi:magnesium chelatase subunit H
MRIVVLYVGSSLLAPLRNAERELNAEYGIGLTLDAYNFGAPFTNDDWEKIETSLRESDVVFVIHVMDGENAARLMPLLDRFRKQHRAVVVINCMPELMKRTRMGKLDFGRLPGLSRKGTKAQSIEATEADPTETRNTTNLLSSIGSWVGKQARRGGSPRKANGHSRAQYLKFVEHLPAALRFVPSAGALRDVKNYLMLFTYFLQPTPANIRSMVLYALKHYVEDERLRRIDILPPESTPSVGIYHPDASAIFESFEEYESWYQKRARHEAQSTKISPEPLNPKSTLGLLLMRPQIVSNARKHYDELIRAIEAEGLSVIPAISTLMDNREACQRFFLEPSESKRQKTKGRKTKATDHEQLTTDKPRVSQIVSLTGFSFVGGPAMNDSEAAADFLKELNVPYRSLVSLDAQTIESWSDSFTGLNPVQTGMQVSIPEIDGATEPFVFGGIPARGVEPAALTDRCQRVARRLKRWHRLQVAPREELKVALVLYCFPPNKGNLGTAADLDVFASLFDLLTHFKQDGYQVELPADVDDLRALLLGGNSADFGVTANVACRISLDEYLSLCPFVGEIEGEWGKDPGKIGSHGNELLIQGIMLGNVFVGVQPTFGFEDDPMRLLMAQGGTPHHGFAAFYTYLEKIFKADAVVHVGTHGAMEFMPGKQVGLSGACWPDRLIGELPNIYIYSVNNPSEGTIAKRRSYAELISYLTPPIENAGLYKGLAELKDSIMSYRLTDNEAERARLFQLIEAGRRGLNLEG